MDNEQDEIKVNVPLNEIEFLNLDDVDSKQERSFLLGCVRSKEGLIFFDTLRRLNKVIILDAGLPGGSGLPWQTPRRGQSEELDFGFGSATAVFHSLQQGGAGVTAASEPVPADTSTAALQPPPPGPSPQHISLPPYLANIPLPGTQGAQTIHINNFTANLNFPPAPVTTAVSSQSGSSSLPPQPLPFTVGYPSAGPYVAPFPLPQTSPSPPVFPGSQGGYPGHIMVYQPPLHLSMYPQPPVAPHGHYPQPPPEQPSQPAKDLKETTPVIMFGSTPVVSVRHSSSDEEAEAETRAKPPMFASKPVTKAQIQTIPGKEMVKEQTDMGQKVVMDQPQPQTEVARKEAGSSSAGKSWASLFSPSQAGLDSAQVLGDKPIGIIPPFTPTSSSGQGEAKISEEDRRLSLFLRDYSLQHMAPAFLPRGLTNRSNWCFVNAILQALLACPPFYNLMKSLPTVGGLKLGKSSTPMIDSVVEFVNEMSPLETMNKNQKKDKARKKEDLPTGNPLEPSYVYKTLLNLESETFKVVEGRQEDAEEFLTCLLNMISDEMAALLKMTASEAEQPPPPGQEAQGDWQEVSGRGRSQVTRRVTEQGGVVTPLQELALGLCRSSVKSANNESSATLQPFYTLQLDIQSDSISSVTDALVENFSSEILDGYICSKTNMAVEASRILSLEELPPILILHLKRFVYSGTSGGGVQKVMKHVEFSVDLEISRDLLSQVNKSKFTAKQRQYKLFAVVNHTGREATKGHYVTDVYHTGYASWLHCDDSIIQPAAEQLVTSPQAHSTPYILFYRRGDTMVGVEKTVK